MAEHIQRRSVRAGSTSFTLPDGSVSFGKGRHVASTWPIVTRGYHFQSVKRCSMAIRQLRSARAVAREYR